MRAKKSLGQHFLRCAWVADALIAASRLTKKDTALEIGSGTGFLRRPLAAASGLVLAVEKDERLAAALSVALKQEGIMNVEIIAADILEFIPRLSSASHLLPTTYKLIANIPYYLTARLIRTILESEHKPKLVALTVQKEVAQRIVAKPPRMNLLALSVQAFGSVKIIKTVPAECFSPKPKVDSAIIVISDISDDFFQKNGVDAKDFFRVIRAAFGQKRKQLVNTLTNVTGDKKTAQEILRAARIDPSSRPEALTLIQWVSIVHAII